MINTLLTKVAAIITVNATVLITVELLLGYLMYLTLFTVTLLDFT